jgi:hypothetical protein
MEPMKRATRTKVLPSAPEEKPRKRWRKKVLTLLDSWSTEGKKLTLIYGSQNCRIQQNGSLAKLWKDTYCFINQSGLRVFLCPDDWKSLQFEENLGIVLVIDGLIGDGGFILRENTEKGPEPLEIPNDVLVQLAHWADQQAVLLVLFHSSGLYTMSSVFRAAHLSKGQFTLFDEKTSALHAIHLENCLKIELRKGQKLELRKGQKIQLAGEREVCSVFLQDAQHAVEIADFSGTAEDALARLAKPSDLIH